MKRGTITAIAATAAAATLSLSGCTLSMEGQAREDAEQKAKTIHSEISGPANRTWTAEQLGRAASRRQDMTLLGVSGTTIIEGVTLTVKVEGYAQQTRFPSGEEQSQTFDFCFDLQFQEGSRFATKEVACPATPAVSYAPPPPPQLPTIEALTKALVHATDEQSVRKALASLKIDKRATVSITTKDQIVGIALKAVDTDRHGMDCRLARVRPGSQPEVWRPASVQLQPGELSCSAAEAARGLGQEAPH